MDHKASRKVPCFAYLRPTEIQLTSESSLVLGLIFLSGHDSSYPLGCHRNPGVSLWLKAISEF